MNKIAIGEIYTYMRHPKTAHMKKHQIALFGIAKLLYALATAPLLAGSTLQVYTINIVVEAL